MSRYKFGIVFLLLATVMGCNGSDSSAANNGEAATGQNTVQNDGADASASSEHPGKQTYEAYCFSCHAVGLSGAPKLGDVEAWAPRIAKGIDLLLAATIEGVPPAMPARGICSSCSDEELRQSIEYMIEASQ